MRKPGAAVGARGWVGVGLFSLVAAACSGGGGATQPPLPPCTASGDTLSLALGVYTAFDPTAHSGCAVIPTDATGSAVAYLLVPQAVNGVADDSSAFLLRGGALAAAPPAPAEGGGSPQMAQERFDLTLRRAERALALRAGPPVRPPAAPPVTPAPPVPGSTRSFNVCGDLTCGTHPSVTATAKTVGQHVALYVDNAASAAGDTLSTVELDSLVAVFDTLLYPRDTAAFGRESDVDANGVVIVLMTGKVNSLVTSTQCTTLGFVAGYFYGGDLLLGFSGGNYGEIFYSLVPDPSGLLSCVHSASQIDHLVPVTFIHEFQHMISWNQHYLRHGTAPEDLWLNEGLSHYAEELGGRRLLPDTTSYCRYLVGDLYNSGSYLTDPAKAFLVDTSGIGGLANRGAYWLFVRFLVDQVAPVLGRADSVTRALENTTLTGAANVANVAATPFATVLERWALASYVSDLGGFSAPPELQYTSWRFRSDYPTMHTACANRGVTSVIPSAFPLAPGTGTASAVNLAGTLRGGSGTYFIAQQANGAPGVTLLFSNGSGAALRTTLAPRLNVLRIQ